jgi:hypothetical protein
VVQTIPDTGSSGSSGSKNVVTSSSSFYPSLQDRSWNTVSIHPANMTLSSSRTPNRIHRRLVRCIESFLDELSMECLSLHSINIMDKVQLQSKTLLQDILQNDWMLPFYAAVFIQLASILFLPNFHHKISPLELVELSHAYYVQTRKRKVKKKHSEFPIDRKHRPSQGFNVAQQRKGVEMFMYLTVQVLEQVNFDLLQIYIPEPKEGKVSPKFIRKMTKSPVLLRSYPH